MPCNGDYLNATRDEVQISIVYSLLDELETNSLNQNYYKGYHPEVYNKAISYKTFTEKVQELCTKLSKTDVSNYSLEMQMWWKKHTEEDNKRKAKEAVLDEKLKQVTEIWNKLTQEEKFLIKDCSLIKTENNVIAVPLGMRYNYETKNIEYVL